MKKQKGFSLIELLIVVAIILIIAAIAIPNLLRARMAANEAGSAAAIRTINTAEIAYQSANPTIGFANTLAILGPGATCGAATACLIDSVMASGTKSGYSYTLAAAGGPPAVTYLTVGTPLSASTGTRMFCAIQDAVVRAALTAAGCTGATAPLQ